MSTSNLYRVFRTKTVHAVAFRNGWGTAPILWNYLCRKFLGRDTWLPFDPDLNQRLWDLAVDGRLPRELRIVHAFTFDRAVCPLARKDELADACEAASKTCAAGSHVNHWEAIAVELRKVKARPRQLGWALSCTSVNDVWLDWRGDPPHWDLFDVLIQQPLALAGGAS